MADLTKVKYYMHLIASHPYAGTPAGQVLDETLNTDGKMLRASLVLHAGAFGPDFETKKDRLEMLAAMVELTHLASLVHDDIVDEADFRRGRQSIQSKYSKDAAVYAGDFLITRVNYYEAKERLNEASAVLSKTIERMCAGEIAQALCRYKETTSIAEYMSNITGKTVELFKAACRIGAQEAGADEELTDKLEAFGENLGIMFQLRDDLLDFTSSKAETGKSAHMDFREGIYTMPVLCALKADGSGKLLAMVRKNAIESLSDKEISETEQMVVDLGGVEATVREIRCCHSKIEGLLEALPHSPSKSLLSELVSKLVI